MFAGRQVLGLVLGLLLCSADGFAMYMCFCCCTQVDTVGEIVLEVGALQGWGPACRSSEQLAAVLARIRECAVRSKADVAILRERTVDAAGTGGQLGAGAATGKY